MAGEISPLLDGIKLAADAAAREALWPVATRPQNARVYRIDGGVLERWSGSTWIVDMIGFPVLSGELGVTNMAFAVGDPRRYGASAGTAVDSTSAFQAAVTAATTLNTRSVIFSEHQYVIGQAGVVIPTAFTFKGASLGRSVLMHRPSADGSICVKVTGSGAQAINNRVGNFSVASDDITHQKTAVEVDDVSSLAGMSLYVYGTGTGTPSAPYYTGGASGSIGFRSKGREATSFGDVRIVADRPIVISANPNTIPNDGEDIDHWSFENLYTVAKGYYNFVIDDGLGFSNLSIRGYLAMVGGVGGLKINDTRAAPTIPPRLLSIQGLRYEQCTDANGYGVNVSAATPIQTIRTTDCLVDATAQGYLFNNVLQLLLQTTESAAAAGKDSLKVTGATSGSSIDMEACFWQGGSNFTLTGYTATDIRSWNTALQAGPSSATYANVITNTLVNVAKVTANAAAATVGLLVQATSSGDALAVRPNAAAAGASVLAFNNAQTDYTPLALTASTYDFRYRTGVGTSATAFGVDTSGFLNTGKVVSTVAAATVGHVIIASAGGDGLQILPLAAAGGANIRGVNNAQSDFTPIALTASSVTAKIRTGVATTQDGVIIDTAGLKINIAGTGLLVKEGTNATMGTAVLVGGTLVVATTKVTATARIFLTTNVPGGAPGWLQVSARVNGTSFTILSSSGTDTSTVAWLIVEPA